MVVVVLMMMILMVMDGDGVDADDDDALSLCRSTGHVTYTLNLSPFLTVSSLSVETG